MGKSRPRRGGTASRVRVTASPVPAPPVPLPDPPAPVPVPVPPAPVPGPATFDAPWVGAAPWFGVGDVFTGSGIGIAIGGLGATTGVARLCKFFSEAAPSRSFGFCVSSAGFDASGVEGGGGSTSVMSNVRSTLCGSANSIRPDKCRKANSKAAWMAATAAMAPLLSRVLRSERYIMAGQRNLMRDGCGAVTTDQIRETPGGEGSPGVCCRAAVVSGSRCLGLRPPP